MPFYLAYALCIIPDSIFISKGSTYLNMINSLLINFLYYGIWFLIYILVNISINLNMIILMFGFGMVFHMVISYVELIIYKKYVKLLQ